MILTWMKTMIEAGTIDVCICVHSSSELLFSTYSLRDVLDSKLLVFSFSEGYIRERFVNSHEVSETVLMFWSLQHFQNSGRSH